MGRTPTRWDVATLALAAPVAGAGPQQARHTSMFQYLNEEALTLIAQARRE